MCYYYNSATNVGSLLIAVAVDVGGDYTRLSANNLSFGCSCCSSTRCACELLVTARTKQKEKVCERKRVMSRGGDDGGGGGSSETCVSEYSFLQPLRVSFNPQKQYSSARWR